MGPTGGGAGGPEVSNGEGDGGPRQGGGNWETVVEAAIVSGLVHVDEKKVK